MHSPGRRSGLATATTGHAWSMTRPELARSGNNPIGEKTPPGAPDEPMNQTKDTIGPVPEANAPGHSPDEDQDKPIEKFAARFGDDTDE